jgi:beta-lactamase superfamily II metal-dependent hydrolase
MAYEIDFMPVGEGKSGDAISIRYKVPAGSHEVIVVDGGTEASGEALVEHIKGVYGTNVVNYMVCTHPDNDHACGLRTVLNSLEVKQVWIHIPWAHADRTRHLFGNDAWTTQRLKDTIRRNYPVVEELFELANEKKALVKYPFQGEKIGPLIVAAPSLGRYEGLLPQFRDTPAPDETYLRLIGHWITGIGRRTTRFIQKSVLESLDKETLREGGVTSAENESSVILYGDFPGDICSFMLTGDSGLLGLNEAIDYLMASHYDLRRLGIVQVPHHGSRNNIAPSVLNRLIGEPLSAGVRRSIYAVVSASLEDDDHPRQIVVNAFDRRGATVTATHGRKTWFWRGGMPARTNWGVPAVTLPFSKYVEEYD